LEAVTFGLAPATLKLSELIELQLFEVQPRAERKAIAVIYQNDDPEITVTIDEYCLAHALANLLDNAIKFTERGRVMVRVYRQCDSSICVEVRDTGIGIGPCYLRRLFEPFSQEDDDQARRYQGMGLGLALAKRYLAMNGADLAVASRKQLGSVFTIRLEQT
jgi:signal transduction histidine kinase